MKPNKGPGRLSKLSEKDEAHLLYAATLTSRILSEAGKCLKHEENPANVHIWKALEKLGDACGKTLASYLPVCQKLYPELDKDNYARWLAELHEKSKETR